MDKDEKEVDDIITTFERYGIDKTIFKALATFKLKNPKIDVSLKELLILLNFTIHMLVREKKIMLKKED